MKKQELIYIRNYILDTSTDIMKEHPHIKQANFILNSSDSLFNLIFPDSSEEKTTYMIGEQNAYLG